MRSPAIARTPKSRRVESCRSHRAALAGSVARSRFQHDPTRGRQRRCLRVVQSGRALRRRDRARHRESRAADDASRCAARRVLAEPGARRRMWSMPTVTTRPLRPGTQRYRKHPRRACAILTADCVPVLFCDRAGTMVGAAHCGWRGSGARRTRRVGAAHANRCRKSDRVVGAGYRAGAL